MSTNERTIAPAIVEPEFEGEETLGAEARERLSANEEVATDIYPDATVNIVPESASVFQLKRKRDKIPPLLKLDPDFQRLGNVWNPKQKSELIESIIMGIPLPLIYVKEDDRGVYIIVDGRQRLTTLFQFMNNEFPLQKLSVLKGLNDAYFSKTSDSDVKHDKYLSQAHQSKVEDCPLTLHVIKPPTPDRVTFDLFDRVNRGGTRLNNQEMRNAIYQGEATKLLNKLVNFKSFKDATENAIKPDRMKDRYLVLRMVGFYLWREKKLLSVKEKDLPLVEYRSDLEDFLGKTMMYLNHPKGSEFCHYFPEMFNKTMQMCNIILGEGCFRQPPKKNGPRRPISMALFETVSYLMIRLKEIPENKYHSVKSHYNELFKNEDFVTSTTYVVDSNKSVKKRFKLIENLVEELRNA